MNNSQYANRNQQIELNRSSYQQNTFKIQDNEVYMIKESNIKRANEILKKSIYSKPSQKGINVSQDMQMSNALISNSLKETSELFCLLYGIEESKSYYSNKMNDKFK